MVGIAALIAVTVLASAAAGYRQMRTWQIANALGTKGEQLYIKVGGKEQWIQIRGDDRANPVLFVLHGGPGSPYAVFTPLIREWEKHFTVVQWDRRGVGKTRARSGPAADHEQTFDTMVNDAIEVVEFLRGHLHTDKVVLLAGSMGTLVGLPLVKRRPDLFDAIVCTDFYANMRENEAVGYGMTRDRVRGKRRAKLERIGGEPSTWDLRAWQTKMDLTMKTDPVTPNAVTKLLFPLAITSPIYRLRDVWHLLAGFTATQKQTYQEYMAYDAYQLGPRLEVPFFLFQGAADVLTITELAERYYATVDAPHKAMVLIDDASHFVAFTQPDRFLDNLLREVRPMVTARA